MHHRHPRRALVRGLCARRVTAKQAALIRAALRSRPDPATGLPACTLRAPGAAGAAGPAAQPIRDGFRSDWTAGPGLQPAIGAAAREQTMTIHEYLINARQDDARRAGERDRLLLEAQRARLARRPHASPAAPVKRLAWLLLHRAAA